LISEYILVFVQFIVSQSFIRSIKDKFYMLHQGASDLMHHFTCVDWQGGFSLWFTDIWSPPKKDKLLYLSWKRFPHHFLEFEDLVKLFVAM